MIEDLFYESLEGLHSYDSLTVIVTLQDIADINCLLHVTLLIAFELHSLQVIVYVRPPLDR